jgi:hypothetical protein
MVKERDGFQMDYGAGIDIWHRKVMDFKWMLV